MRKSIVRCLHERMNETDLYLGIDVGTSGVRASVIDQQERSVASASVSMPSPKQIDGRACQNPLVWWDAVTECIVQLSSHLSRADRDISDVAAIAVDGTSGTMLFCDEDQNPLTLGYMYNSSGFVEQANQIACHAPDDTIARGSSSGLARMLFLQTQLDVKAQLMHQADWVAAKLTRKGGVSDETNALKTGYDVVDRCWPDWMDRVGVWENCLPRVVPVGQTIGIVDDPIGKQLGFSEGTNVVAGTTDSNAAFLASGATEIGDGVTSLGTTLAIKLLSDKPVIDFARGVYSHRIGSMWLPGGASNSGGGVLLDHFSEKQMGEMQASLSPDTPTGLDYYPLSRPGERFPINDPNLQPRLKPRPTSDTKFFQAILEGIASIEGRGYAALSDLGAPSVQRVFTAGGGARNRQWSAIRQSTLAVPVIQSVSTDASMGTARIAKGIV